MISWWLLFFAIVFFTYILFAFVIPYGKILAYRTQWNIWMEKVEEMNNKDYMNGFNPETEKRQ